MEEQSQIAFFSLLYGISIDIEKRLAIFMKDDNLTLHLVVLEKLLILIRGLLLMLATRPPYYFKGLCKISSMEPLSDSWRERHEVLLIPWLCLLTKEEKWKGSHDCHAISSLLAKTQLLYYNPANKDILMFF